MFAGNVKSGNPCPKCGSEDTSKAATIKFTGTTYDGQGCGVSRWNDIVEADRTTVVALSSTRLSKGRDGWREQNRIKALGLR